MERAPTPGHVACAIIALCNTVCAFIGQRSARLHRLRVALLEQHKPRNERLFLHNLERSSAIFKRPHFFFFFLLRRLFFPFRGSARGARLGEAADAAVARF